MHAVYSQSKIMERWPEVDPEHAAFLAGLYKEIQDRITDFRMVQSKDLKDEKKWQSDLMLASMAHRLRIFGSSVMNDTFGKPR